MKVLIIGADDNYCSFLSRKLTAPTMRIYVDNSLDTALPQLEKSHFDVVLCCLPLLKKYCPFEVIKRIGTASAMSRIILICDELPLHTAMELKRSGMYSAFVRPFPLNQLVGVLGAISIEVVAGPAQKPIEKAVEDPDPMASAKYVRGKSIEANKLYEQIDLVGPTNFSVIVYGETGTGKESVASRIATKGHGSQRYIAVDCGCLSKELALSELFGHEKGSFTGAIATKIGAFELANNGTLFLDEIGNLDYEVQGYLLRAIQERKIKRVGGTKDIEVNTRIIVASNENLAESVKDGKFREDLFHRLNEFQITVPSLRRRPDDIVLFIERFLGEANKELDKNVGMPDVQAMEILSKYEWPGNIRELRNLIRRTCLLSPDNKDIGVDDLPAELVARALGQKLEPESSPETGAGRVQVKARDITIDKIRQVLKAVRYNKTKAAELLGIDRKTIYNKLKETY